MSKDHQLVTVGQLGAGGICSVCLAPDKPIRHCLQQWPQEFECLKSLSHLSQWSPEVRKTHFYWELSGANLLLRIIWLAWVTDTNFFIKWQNITSFQCPHMLTHHGALTSPLVLNPLLSTEDSEQQHSVRSKSAFHFVHPIFLIQKFM